MKQVASRIPLALLAAVLTTVAPSTAPAASIPPPVIEVGAAGGTGILTVGTVSGTQCLPGGCQNSTATATYDGFNATVSGLGSTTVGVGIPPNSSGTATVTFFFWAQGQASGVTVTTVPLIFTGSDSTSASGPSAAAYAYFQTPGGQIDSCSAAGSQVGTCGTLPPSNSGTLHYNAVPCPPNAPTCALYDVSVLASGSSSLGTGSWSASVDPEVEIGPNFAYASDFSLVFSPGPTTPEPGSLALFGSGVLGLGALLRRSRRN